MDTPVVSKIKDILVENWENAFLVKETASDVDVYVEVENNDTKTGLWEFMPMRIEGKYIKIFKVPVGYIGGFIRDNVKT